MADYRSLYGTNGNGTGTGNGYGNGYSNGNDGGRDSRGTGSGRRLDRSRILQGIRASISEGFVH